MLVFSINDDSRPDVKETVVSIMLQNNQLEKLLKRCNISMQSKLKANDFRLLATATSAELQLLLLPPKLPEHDGCASSMRLCMN